MEPESHPSIDPVEEIVAACLADPSGDSESAFEKAIQEHPRLAHRLRSQYELLKDAGLLHSPQEDDVEGFPETLGEFHLRERLGGGGMGVVYRALQESLNREVALKLIRPEHLYFPGSRQRFRRETEVVARLKHPGIVPIFTVGEEKGLPYFAMELVEGKTLAEWIHELQKGDRDKLRPSQLGFRGIRDWADACCEIGRQVALALHHAHERGVVHRDVKPSNIILTPDGRAQLLDFGLAMGQGSAAVTRSGSQPGTMAYMSPEQVRGEAVDSRTDLYSLGATLYELLALVPPFELGSDEEMRRRILDSRPRRLRDLNHGVSRDLAIVIETAMAPEAERRYQKAAALAADLDNVHRKIPIQARSAGPWLRSKRFFQRHPSLAVGLVLGLLLVVSLPAALFLKERDARQRIAAEAEVSRAVTRFLVDLFREVDPKLARGNTMPARAVFDRGTRRIRNELADQPAVQAELMQVAGEVYQNLGLFKDAQPLIEQALKLRQKVLGQEGVQLASAKYLLARLFHATARYNDSIQLYREVIHTWAAQSPPPPDLVEARLEYAQVLMETGSDQEARDLFETSLEGLRNQAPEGNETLALALDKYGMFLLTCDHYRKAEPVLREAVTMFDRFAPEKDPDRVRLVVDLANCLERKAGISEAHALYERALEQARTIFDPGHPMIALTLLALTDYLVDRGQARTAIPCLDEAEEIVNRIYPDGHPAHARVHRSRALLLVALGDNVGGEKEIQKAVELYRKALPRETEELADLLNAEADVFFYSGRLAEAEKVAREALALHRSLRHGRKDHLADCMGNLARILSARNQFEEAQEISGEALRLMQEWYGGDHPVVARSLEAVANVSCFHGDGKEGEKQARLALAMWRRLGAKEHAGLAYSLFLVGWSLNLQKRWKEALDFLEPSLEMYRKVSADGGPGLSMPLSDLGVSYANLGRLAEAADCLEESLAIRRRSMPKDSNYLALAILNLATLREKQKEYANSASMAWEALETLRAGRARGDFKVQYAIELQLRNLGRQAKAGVDVRPGLHRLQGFARQLLPEKHRARVEIQRRLRAEAAKRK